MDGSDVRARTRVFRNSRRQHSGRGADRDRVCRFAASPSPRGQSLRLLLLLLRHDGGGRPGDERGLGPVFQTRPKLHAYDRNSGAILQVTSSDNQQAIEFGWWVSKIVFHDTLPHLITNAVVNDAPTCLNACGFVPAHGSRIGSPVKVGTLASYTIKRAKNRWLLVYNRKVVGYYPTSLWKGKLNKSYYEAAFGVVAATSRTKPRSQMGNGQPGTATRSAKVVGMKLIGAAGIPTFSYVSLEAPNMYQVGHYDVGCITACSMNYGGRGF